MPDPVQNDTSSIIAQIVDLFKGLGGDSKDNANNFANVADPFRQERPQYQEMLKKLLTEPGSFSLDPGQKFALDQGLEGVARKGNAMFGGSRSGNTAIELDKFGTGFANQAYNDRIKQLMDMSGVNSGNPAAAAALLEKGDKENDLDLGGGFKGLENIFGAIFGKGGGGMTDIFKGLSGGITGLFNSIFGGGAGDLLEQLNNNGINTGMPGDADAEDIMNQLRNLGLSDEDLTTLTGDGGLFDGGDLPDLESLFEGFDFDDLFAGIFGD